jgi:hypothetical protein
MGHNLQTELTSVTDSVIDPLVNTNGSIIYQLHCCLLHNKCWYLCSYCKYNGLHVVRTLLWVLPYITTTLLCHQMVLCNGQQTFHQAAEVLEDACLTDGQ